MDGVFKMLRREMVFVFAHLQNDVELQFQRQFVHLLISLSGTDEVGAFLGIYHFRQVVDFMRTCLYFNDYQPIVFLGTDIDFKLITPPICFAYQIAFAQQRVARSRLAFFPEIVM